MNLVGGVEQVDRLGGAQKFSVYFMTKKTLRKELGESE